MGISHCPAGITKQAPGLIPRPAGPGRLDRMRYRSVHFYGARLSGPLAEAAAFLSERDGAAARPTHVLCLHAEFCREQAGSDHTWRVTLVFSDPGPDLPAPDAAAARAPDPVFG